MSPFKAKLRWTRRSVLAVMMAISTVSVLGGVLGASATPTSTEDALIETLIQRVAVMTNLKFIRNGATATSTEAAHHMRDKYAYLRRDVVTAEDFTNLCGTRSEVTLQPCRVRRQVGSEQLTADLLCAELRALRPKPGERPNGHWRGTPKSRLSVEGHSPLVDRQFRLVGNPARSSK